MPKLQKALPVTTATLGPATALAMGFTETSGANSISMVMYNAAQAQQAVQQVEVATLGAIIPKLIQAMGSGGKSQPQ